MKTIILSILLFSALQSWAQVTHSDTTIVSQDPELRVYTVVDEMPEFPGGDDSMSVFLGSHLNYPSSALKDKIWGRVVIRFVVDKDGSLSDFSFLRKIRDDLDAEAMRVAMLLPKFKPGKQGGKLVKVAYLIPFMFRLPQ